MQNHENQFSASFCAPLVSSYQLFGNYIFRDTNSHKTKKRCSFVQCFPVLHLLATQPVLCCQKRCRRMREARELLCPSSPPSYQSGIGVRAIRMTARIAPTNAAAPMTANIFFWSFFFAAVQISAAQAMQTTAATSAIPSVSHSQDSSYRIFMRSSSPVR